MKALSKPHKNQPDFDWNVDSPALHAKLRMVILPTDEKRDASKQFLFPHEDLWVPVNVVNGNIHILPGVPRLCKYTARPANTRPPYPRWLTNTAGQSRSSWTG